MAKLSCEERKARDAAFAELLASVNPESAVRQEMIATRVRAGLTQAQLARRMGTTQSVIARLERGGRSPSVKTLRRLAQVTGSRLVVRLEVGDSAFKGKDSDEDA
jgi:transcriptional regulator with XRE-family HTH domain